MLVNVYVVTKARKSKGQGWHHTPTTAFVFWTRGEAAEFRKRKNLRSQAFHYLRPTRARMKIK